MSVKKDNRIKSATFLTTLLDFTEAGELGVFVDEQQIAQMEEQMEKDGFLDGSDMATTFNMLKPNEMIWSFYINNYLLGKELSAFDMLYWNADSTRLTSKSHSFYLRNMYQKNCFKDPGGITLCNVSIDLRKIKVPSYFLSTKEDHIALWRSTYRGTNILQGNVTFTLTASGHVAGVVNHPANNKYSYWVNNKIESSPEAWLEGSTEHKGSWWPHWHEWNKAHSGKLAPAKSATDSKIGVIEDAPGRYVLVK
jgi:polyhydroxyalkanoate synthase